MAEQFNGSVNISSNIASVASQIKGGLTKITNGFEELVGIVQDLEKVNRQYSKSLGTVADASDDAVKSVNKLNSELGDDSGVQRSKRNLSNYVKTVNELRSALGKGAKAEGFFPDSASAIAEIKQLEDELLGLVNVYRTSFGGGELLRESFTTEGAINELQDFRERIDRLTQDAFRGFENVSDEVRGLEDALTDVNNVGLRPTNAEVALANFQELRAEGNQLSDRIVEIQNEMRSIGPAASLGSQEAIQQMGDLAQELSGVQSRAGDVARQLRLAQGEFQRQVGGRNQQLQAFGFRPISVEDIFPTSEQQRLKAVQRSIQQAAIDSAQEGAVRTALNAFLSTNAQLERVDENIISLTGHLPRLRYALYDVSNSFTVLGAGLIAVGGSVIKVAADFDRAFADVERTVFNATDKSTRAVSRLRDELKAISTDIPVTFEDLANIATLAGQLNIAEERVASFTETVAKFAATTDVTIEAAATAFGRLDQLVFGVDGQFEKLASSILAVGVNSVATESDIIAITGQISSIANIAGISASELVGFSSALASVGTRPELARGTFTRLFTEIQQSVAAGDDQLAAFARTAGQSSEQFAAAWGAGSGTEQIIAILEGLNAAGTDADRVLAELGITSVRDVPTLLKLAQSIDEVKRQIQIANIGFIEGVELNNQYSVISATLSSRLQVLSNAFQSLVDTVGSSTAGFGLFIDALTGILKVIERLIDNPITGTLLAMATAATIAAGAVSIFGGGVLRAIGSVTGLLTTMIEVNTAIAVTALGIKSLDVDLKRNTVTVNGATASYQGLSTAMATTGAGAAAASGGFKAMMASLFGVGQNLKGVSVLTRAGYWGAAIAGILGLIGVVDIIGERFGWWGDRIDQVNDKFGDLEPFMQAVIKDTQDFRNGLTSAADGLVFFNGEVDNSNMELSKRGEIIAAVTGQEDLLKQSVDGASTAIANQTLVIGENTQALIKQKIAQDLANKAASVTPEAVRRALTPLTPAEQFPASDGPGGAFPAAAVGRELMAPGIGIGSLFEIVTDPALNQGLIDAGFNFSEWANAVATGNESVANSTLAQLVPAAEALKASLVESDPTGYADAITYLDGIIAFGVTGLQDYASAGSDLQTAIKNLVFEQTIMGQSFADTGDEIQSFRDSLKGAFGEAYAEVNAQREMENAIRSLGAAFAEEAPSVVVNSREMQDALFAIIDTASNPQEAIAGLSGFYNAIVDGGYASKDQLAILEQAIIDTYRTATLAQIEALRQAQQSLSVAAKMNQVTSGIMWSGGQSAEAKKFADYNRQIAQLEASLDNIQISTGSSAESAGLLAEGYSGAKKEAAGTAKAAKDVADETKEAAKEVRTLLDYASDLEKVFSRAFDIRFGTQAALDRLTAGWESFAENVNDAKNAVEELKQSQEDLAADLSIKQYFLSVAEAYGDTLRAAQLRSEIAELESKRLQQQAELEKAQNVTDSATALEGDSEQARANRAALTGLVKNYQDYIKVLAESGATQDELKQATEQARQQFIQQATELGFQREIVLEYAAAFDDVQTAISNVERNITVEANVDPALTALAELRASLQKNIDKAKELNSELGQDGGSYTPPTDPNAEEKKRIRAEIKQLESGLAGASGSDRRFYQIRIDALKKRLALLWTGGYTGAGGKYEPAGIVHRGEYVVPKHYVDQSRGVPNAAFLAQMQNANRGYAQGGFVGGGDGPMMVELSPYDRKLLADAGNVQLRLNGRVVAEATNASNYNEARRGSN